jgi:hypothetical protein
MEEIPVQLNNAKRINNSYNNAKLFIGGSCIFRMFSCNQSVTAPVRTKCDTHNTIVINDNRAVSRGLCRVCQLQVNWAYAMPNCRVLYAATSTWYNDGNTMTKPCEVLLYSLVCSSCEIHHPKFISNKIPANCEQQRRGVYTIYINSFYCQCQ